MDLRSLWRSSLWRTWGDLAIAVGLGAGLAVEVASYPAAQLPVAAVAAAVTGLVLAARRRLPLLAAVLTMAGIQAVTVVAADFQRQSVFLTVVFLLALYSLGRHARGLEAWLGVPVVAAAIVLLALDDDGTAVVTQTIFYVFFGGTPWGVGLAVRLRIDRLRDLAVRAAAIEEETRRAIADERVRIARELHDVVSHAIAVTVLQARGSRRLVGRDDDAVRTALAAVASTNIAASADMRRLFAVLRDTEQADAEDGDPVQQPEPGIDRLGEVAEQVRASGVPVELVVEGDPLPMTPGVELSAYRIVQEALTNVLKHGGEGAQAVVRVRYEPDELRLDVDSTVPGGPRPSTGGYGLVGIRERAAVVGGRVEAGPADGGWRVHAMLPYLVPAQVP